MNLGNTQRLHREMGFVSNYIANNSLCFVSQEDVCRFRITYAACFTAKHILPQTVIHDADSAKTSTMLLFRLPFAEIVEGVSRHA